MNITERTDEEILTMDRPLWRDLVRSSNEGKYGEFSKNFSSSLARAMDQVAAGTSSRTAIWRATCPRSSTRSASSPRSFRDTTRGLEGIETRTIAREAELGQMQSAFEKMLSDSQTHLISLVAEAGIGKSRVLFEFGKWLDAHEQQVLLFKGRAAQETSQIPYALLRGILSPTLEIREDDRASTARQKLERGFQQLTANPEAGTLYAHFIGHLIGLDYSSSPHLRGILGDARQIRNLAFHDGSELLADMARKQPVVIFLEDIHWADAGSLDFFDHLMNTQPDLRLLVVGLTRVTLFEQRPDWGTGPVQHLSLNLLPLSEADTRLLILEILQKVPQVPDELVNLIVKKAEGSPFYVEELVKVLIEGGVILSARSGRESQHGGRTRDTPRAFPTRMRTT